VVVVPERLESLGAVTVDSCRLGMRHRLPFDFYQRIASGNEIRSVRQYEYFGGSLHCQRMDEAGRDDRSSETKSLPICHPG
jgi:hypothetical protein